MMKEFATPLSERLRQSEIHRRKYQSDPDYRLRCINRGRVWQGLQPRASIDDVQARNG